MKRAEWVKMVKDTGGVPESSPDTLAALRAASTMCWVILDQMGNPHTEIAQLGVKWTAAFMVSCARHGATDFHSILLPSDHRQELFRREAGRSYGVLAKILGEAADAPRKQFRAALLASGTHLIIASTGRGKGVGG